MDSVSLALLFLYCDVSADLIGVWGSEVWGSKGQLSEGTLEGSDVQLEGSEGQPGELDVQIYGGMNGRTDVQSFSPR